MNTEELTQVVTAHQSAIARHEQEMAEIRTILNQVARQQQTNAQQIALNREDIGELKASILDLRNLVADYIQNREKTEE